ncbi:uncharacterized protein [Procambarus clarkii]|uniref:uncharacterized protein n=1 Tax=Procambarus clarkii TaxID=6728 RepID=UPI003742B37A
MARPLVAVVAIVAVATTAASSMDDTIHSLLAMSPKGEMGRFFLNYDHTYSFNTTVPVTMPLLSFTLPGAGDFSTTGATTSSYSALGYIIFFLLGGFVFSLYTTAPGAAGRENTDGDALQELQLVRLVLETVWNLPEVLNCRNCAKQAVCKAYADPQDYGFLASALRFLVAYTPDTPEEELTEFQKAARYGEESADCHYKFHCLVHPLDLLLYIYDYWFTDE